MDFEAQNNKLLKQLEEIKYSSTGIIERSNKSIIICRNLLNTYRKTIATIEFDSIQHEIYFFKTIKQVPFSQLIYYSEIRSFEIQFPKADRTEQSKFLKKKLGKLNRFFLYNMDFVQYIESKHTHLDEHYFTRNYLDQTPITSSKFYFQDPDFCTPYDLLFGKLKAYHRFINYLQDKLSHIEKANNNNSTTPPYQPELEWTSSKTALTELIYALHHNRVINNGKSDIKDIASALEKVFHFQLGDYYKTFAEIKTRKISRTKFLDDLSEGLLSYINSTEE
ncbi:RteC protein [Jejuia pallidilutea]|uniref:RteC protein n=1 Tax=Jejuia pallidilutea TaxID=504487 RepID=A0A362X3I7_9FLAO|nr:RteC domain-containing protein [Jejuia pallidilutea]PQV51448.1 RteC protein [Jejuia pallidilutea]